MTDFRTKIAAGKAYFLLDFDTKLLSVGSCFAENIGSILQTSGFENTINPNGIIFHPLALARALKWWMGEDVQYTQIQDKGKFHSLLHHGSFSRVSQEDFKDEIAKSRSIGQDALKSAEVLLVTFGTAWGYHWTETNEVAANCHRIPQASFTKQRATMEEIVAAWSDLIQTLQKRNSRLKIVLTVSPVRHAKDGLVQNNRSKATLIQAVHALVEQFESCSYFPAYELLLDDLRDYRFFANDMLHPSTLAIDYIFEHFASWCMDDKVKADAAQIRSLRRMLQHIPNENGAKKFAAQIAKMEEKVAAIKAR